MSNKSKLRIPFVGVLLLVVGLCFGSLYFKKSAFQQYDATRLDRFVHRIAGADRIVGMFSGRSVRVTIAGDNVEKVVRAVRSSISHRPPDGTEWKCYYGINARFFNGTNVLGNMLLCSSAFLADGKEPPFQDLSGTLLALADKPLSEALEKEYETK